MSCAFEKWMYYPFLSCWKCGELSSPEPQDYRAGGLFLCASPPGESQGVVMFLTPKICPGKSQFLPVCFLYMSPGKKHVYLLEALSFTQGLH